MQELTSEERPIDYTVEFIPDVGRAEKRLMVLSKARYRPDWTQSASARIICEYVPHLRVQFCNYTQTGELLKKAGPVIARVLQPTQIKVVIMANHWALDRAGPDSGVERFTPKGTNFDYWTIPFVWGDDLCNGLLAIGQYYLEQAYLELTKGAST